MLWLDHVVYAARDLEVAAERWRRDLGLDAVDGGRHERWGTANRIVPLGEQYLEIVAVVDPATAEWTSFGRAVASRARAGEGWLMPVVATDDLDGLATRLGLEIVDGARRLPDGRELRWRSAGLEDPRRAAWMPFFISWDVPAELHPARARAGHGLRVDAITAIDIAGDEERLRSWLGTDDGLPFRLTPGNEGVRGVVLSTADGERTIL